MRETEPTIITQGERIAWTKTFTDYPATKYTLQYRFRGAGPGADVAATASGSAFAAELTAAATLLLAAGRYQWQAWLTEIAAPTNKFIIRVGSTDVRFGYVSGDTSDADLRTSAKKMLDTIDAALLTAGGSDVIEYEIETPAGSRRVKRSTRSEATAQRKYWAEIVSREIHAARVGGGGKWAKPIKVRMSGS